MNASPLLAPLLLITFSFLPTAPLPPVGSTLIPVDWVDSLQGDYSFTGRWDYPEGIRFNQTGQPVCMADCPHETIRMTDGKGIILEDSLDVYYTFVDTTHQYHSISCNAWCYEWAGTSQIDVVVINPDSVQCTTRTGPGTRCRLRMAITSKNCTPVIDLHGIAAPGSRQFPATGGFISIDQTLWERDTLKARFSFTFHNSIEPGKPVFWRGKILAKIKYTPPAGIESAAIEVEPQ